MDAPTRQCQGLSMVVAVEVGATTVEAEAHRKRRTPYCSGSDSIFSELF